MICRNCGARDSQVIETRSVAEVDGIRRHRQCTTCRAAWLTIEVIVPESYRRRLPALVTRAFAMLKAFEAAVSHQ